MGYPVIIASPLLDEATVMGRRNFAVNLSDDQREELNKRIDDGAETLDELLAWLRRGKDPDFVSRSALGRYVHKRRARTRALESLAETAALPDEGGRSEALDLMMELATLRVKEARILDRLRELGVL
ncbi:phage protein Gp27 family protein [Alloalcanivorax xenomutans]|uniref:DUF3486 family protein n=1 Tax=Alloalcanivorax xenomutans TaxID=1094342 RepID=A0A9Q3W772_9GAMM|nr:phage protein Gp27 family protein [Alloalcanivorax xenomutans]MCE7510294.1 DUF3486 family protein [Alloalcanivorax xenomutans]